MLEPRRHEDHDFVPNFDPAGKANFSRHIFAKEDGSLDEVIRLNALDDRVREEIVKDHFIKQYTEIHYPSKEFKPSFDIVGRDNPWDFDIITHDKKRFYLEICRIADKGLLKAIKSENECAPLFKKRHLKGHEVRKLAKNYPEEVSKELLNSIKTKADSEKVFDMGSSDRAPRNFLRPLPYFNLVKEMQTAIQKKIDKRHDGKDRTILLLDNLTTHSRPMDFSYAAGTLDKFIHQSPFRSIWIYTGYYSDEDGIHYGRFSSRRLKLALCSAALTLPRMTKHRAPPRVGSPAAQSR